jgi:plasmid maintenance system antidote protein VapI
MTLKLVSYGPWADTMTPAQAGEILRTTVASRYNNSNREVINRLAHEVSLRDEATVNEIVPALMSIARSAQIELAPATDLLGSVGNNWTAT